MRFGFIQMEKGPGTKRDPMLLPSPKLENPEGGPINKDSLSLPKAPQVPKL